MQQYFHSEHSKQNIFTIAFYNLENLYDIFNDPNTNDDDFIPSGEKHWTIQRYKNKIEHLGEVITQIGLEHSTLPPVVMGIAEVENESVVRDLVQNKHMKPYNYDFVHYDSPDERGIEVALLYQKEYFELLTAERIPLLLFEADGHRDYTRDVLLVEGNYKGEQIFILVNHWPSRREGKEISENKRMAASQLVTEIIAKIRDENPNAKILVMGDFNDEPNSESIKQLVSQNDLYNPMESLKDKGVGSSYSQDRWYLFDQMLFSKNFFETDKGLLHLKYAEVFDPKFIKTWKGKRKNAPFRTYSGRWHLGGFSDHFPVVAYLEYNE